MRERMTTEKYIEENGRYFEAELKVAKNPSFGESVGDGKWIPTHDSIGFSHKPTKAEVRKNYANAKPHLMITEILSIRDMSHKANELTSFYDNKRYSGD
jgi:hypothetical protein